MDTRTNKQIKICLVAISLGGGGAEKSIALLSKTLSNIGYEIHIVTLVDDIKYHYEGKLFNLGLYKQNDDSIIGKIKRFVKLRKYFKINNFDFILDNRTHELQIRELFYTFYLYKGLKLIYLIRSNNFRLYFPSFKWISMIMIRKSMKIIAVSNFIEEKIKNIYKTKNTSTIYNSYDNYANTPAINSDDNNYILFLGRIEDSVKNISLLLDAYCISQNCNKVSMKIVGDGTDINKIQKQINDLGISDSVKMLPYTANIYDLILNAKFLILTSHYEGFPRVLIESLSIGTPVVSVDCKSGPEEIITHEFNGLLVENYNKTVLANAIDRMYFDDKLYYKCKENAKNSVAHLSQSNIAKEWNKLITNLIE